MAQLRKLESSLPVTPPTPPPPIILIMQALCTAQKQLCFIVYMQVMHEYTITYNTLYTSP